MQQLTNSTNIHSYPRRMLQAELGPDQAKAFRLSSMEPMKEADPSSGTANPPRRRSTYNDALEVRRYSTLRPFPGQIHSSLPTSRCCFGRVIIGRAEGRERFGRCFAETAKMPLLACCTE